MPRPSRQPAVFGPFDGDFDPFEDEEEFGVLIVFGQAGFGRQRLAVPPAA